MIDHLSYSSISRYLKCGKQWKFRYLDKLEEEDSEALLFGSAWHKMIKDGLENPYSNIMQLWSKSFNQVLEEKNVAGDWFIDADILGQRMLSSPDIIATIQGLTQTINPESLEMKTELRIPGVPVPIIGFIDMIQNDGVPIDIKTASKRWSQEKADTDLQATFYIATLEQLGMIKLPAKFKFMVFTKTKSPAVQILETTRTHQDVFNLYGLVNEVWQAISREVFTPTDPGNWWCSHKYCGFWDRCDYGGKNG